MNDFFDALKEIKKDMTKNTTNLDKKPAEISPNSHNSNQNSDKFISLVREFCEFVGKKYE